MSQAPRLTPAKRGARAAREARLAQALRDNLRRRKEQTRGRDIAAEPDPVPPPEPGSDAEPPP